MDPITGSIIGSIAGGGLGAIGSIIGGKHSDETQRQNFLDNIRAQENFAQQGIRWRVADAKAAGIHPLYALGANTHSFSPISTGDTGGGAGIEGAMSHMGQGITRAISAASTGEEKALQTLNVQSAKLDVEGKSIENQIKLSQLRQLQTGPAFPGSDNFIPGQGNSGIKINPAERVVSAPGRPAQEKGWVPDVGYARTDTGLTPIPSRDVKERIEDQMIPEAMWAARNYLMPNITFGHSGKPPLSMLPQGARDWSWSHLKQEWQPDYRYKRPYSDMMKERSDFFKNLPGGR